MQILFLLIPLGVVLMAAAGALLVWAIRSGQYEDLDSVAGRMPDDDPR
ncbi:cbb3-type cytochrome oxidase assembly protein CcoS [Solimonas variicoloris]|nr:cbb3-type cytochrome oxidase assembly protein CcoS [Solimonas variicoloris]